MSPSWFIFHICTYHISLFTMISSGWVSWPLGCLLQCGLVAPSLIPGCRHQQVAAQPPSLVYPVLLHLCSRSCVQYGFEWISIWLSSWVSYVLVVFLLKDTHAHVFLLFSSSFCFQLLYFISLGRIVNFHYISVILLKLLLYCFYFLMTVYLFRFWLILVTIIVSSAPHRNICARSKNSSTKAVLYERSQRRCLWKGGGWEMERQSKKSKVLEEGWHGMPFGLEWLLFSQVEHQLPQALFL